MQTKIFQLLSQCLLCSCLVALLSCGKESEKPEGVTKNPPQPIEEDFEAYLDKQSISCSESSSCPTYIAKIIVRQGPGVYKTCTGFLTDSNTIATSTTCLPDVLRLNGIDCSKDVAFFFYERFSKGLRVACDVVEQATEDYSSNPILNRDDVAFLKIKTPLPFRRILRISRNGFGSNKSTRLVGVEQSDDTNGEIKELDCPSVTNSYVNPLVTNEDSPGFTIAGCPYSEGFTGAPVIDNKFRSNVLGVVSKTMDPSIRKYLNSTGLLINGLKDFIHGSSFACAPTVYDNNVSNERECNKELSTLQVEKLRSGMLSTNVLFSDFKTKLENSLESGTRFVRFDVKLTPKANPNDPSKPNYDIQDVKVTPKCFKDLIFMGTGKYQDITNFKRPSRTFRKVMDDLGKVTGSDIDNGSSKLSMSWNPKELKKNKVGFLHFWDPITEIIFETFNDLPVCQ